MKAFFLTLGMLFCLLQSHSNTHFVSNLNDAGSGSLRKAISDAGMGDVVQIQSSLLSNGSDTIKLLSEIVITKGLLIKGAFSSTDTIYLSGRNNNRIFSLQWNSTEVYFQDLVFIQGYANQGGAIACFNGNLVSLENCIIRNCTADGGSIWHQGGAIYSTVPLELKDCSIENNLAAPSSWAFGGGIYCTSTLSLTNSTIAHNTVNGLTWAHGGGILCEDSLFISHSTISNNLAIAGTWSNGGGIYSKDVVVINHSTICQNEAQTLDTLRSGSGAALYAYVMQAHTGVTIINSTIYNNSSNTTQPTVSQAYAIYSHFPINVSGSIIACNYPVQMKSSNGVYSLGYNLFSDSSYVQLAPTDMYNATVQNLKLEPLDYYGGSTKTLRPKVNSIAINNGNPLDISNAQNIPIVDIRERGSAENCSLIVRDVQSACNSYTWIDGNTYSYSTDTVVYMVALGGGNGCDMAIILDLTISPNTAVIQNGTVISVLDTNGSYQWLDCTNGFAIIPGETNKSFTATQNGIYAVEINANGCIDTSNCVAVSTIGIKEENQEKINLYPNPNNGRFNIELDESTHHEISIFNSNGVLVFSKPKIENSNFQISLGVPSGIYYVVISTAKRSRTFKLVVVED